MAPLENDSSAALRSRGDPRLERTALTGRGGSGGSRGRAADGSNGGPAESTVERERRWVRAPTRRDPSRCAASTDAANTRTPRPPPPPPSSRHSRASSAIIISAAAGLSRAGATRSRSVSPAGKRGLWSPADNVSSRGRTRPSGASLEGSRVKVAETATTIGRVGGVPSAPHECQRWGPGAPSARAEAEGPRPQSPSPSPRW